jgi:DNA-binding NarL/FixJ family response regulator
MEAATKKIRILSVDDHPLLREGLASVIQGEPDMELVGEATNGEEAMQYFRQYRPDVTLMDLQMPGMNGVEAMSAIRREYPDARFIVLTTYEGDVQALRAIKAGASGYLLKNMLRKDLLRAIREVHSGKRFIPSVIANNVVAYLADDGLSEREIAVLQSVAAGKPNKLIADEFAVSEATIKGHMKNIMSKLGANDRTHAVMIALKRGFILNG